MTRVWLLCIQGGVQYYASLAWTEPPINDGWFAAHVIEKLFRKLERYGVDTASGEWWCRYAVQLSFADA